MVLLVVLLVGKRVPIVGVMSTRLFMALYIMHTFSTFLLVSHCCSSRLVVRVETQVELLKSRKIHFVALLSIIWYQRFFWCGSQTTDAYSDTE